jgi:hypothetical protein
MVVKSKNINFIMIFVFIAATLLFHNTVIAECPNNPGQTESGEQNEPNCLNIPFNPPPPDQIDPAVTQQLTIGVSPRNPPPYHWSVGLTDGSGFSLAYATTTLPTNTLNISPSACGTATITVSDNFGNACVKEIRSTGGRWVQISYQHINCTWVALKIMSKEEIHGGDKWTEGWCVTDWQPRSQAELPCSAYCGTCEGLPPHTSPPEFPAGHKCLTPPWTCKWCKVVWCYHYRWKCR